MVLALPPLSASAQDLFALLHVAAQTDDSVYATVSSLDTDAGSQASGGADAGRLRQHRVPVHEPRQDGTHYFDVHPTVADTLDKIDRSDLKRNVAAYAVAAWLSTGYTPGFGRLPVVTLDQ